MRDFLRWVKLTHTHRYHAHYGTPENGHVYQGRLKSFPIQDEEHLGRFPAGKSEQKRRGSVA